MKFRGYSGINFLFFSGAGMMSTSAVVGSPSVQANDTSVIPEISSAQVNNTDATVQNTNAMVYSQTEELGEEPGEGPGAVESGLLWLVGSYSSLAEGQRATLYVVSGGLIIALALASVFVLLRRRI